MSDMRRLIDNLARTARTASYTMTVDTATVVKLIAAAEVAETVVTGDAIDGSDAAIDAYRQATR